MKNPNAYEMKYAKEVIITVKVKLDPVPGAMDNIDDHINLLFYNPYVQSAEIVK